MPLPQINGGPMKKALVQITDFDPSTFTYKYDLGILIPRTVLNHPEQKIYIYDIDENAPNKMSVGIDEEDNIIAMHDNVYYKVLEGVQSNMFLLLAETMPNFQRRSQKRSLNAAADTISDRNLS